MPLESADPTSATLLDRVGLGPGDHVAWARFVDLYGSRIRGWCRRWGLQEAPFGNEPGNGLQGQEPRPGVHPRGDQAARRSFVEERP